MLKVQRKEKLKSGYDTPVRVTIKKKTKQITGVDEDGEKLEPLCIAKYVAAVKNHLVFSQKGKHNYPSSSTCKLYPKTVESGDLQLVHQCHSKCRVSGSGCTLAAPEAKVGGLFEAT